MRASPTSTQLALALCFALGSHACAGRALSARVPVEEAEVLQASLSTVLVSTDQLIADVRQRVAEVGAVPDGLEVPPDAVALLRHVLFDCFSEPLHVDAVDELAPCSPRRADELAELAIDTELRAWIAAEVERVDVVRVLLERTIPETVDSLTAQVDLATGSVAQLAEQADDARRETLDPRVRSGPRRRALTDFETATRALAATSVLLGDIGRRIDDLRTLRGELVDATARRLATWGTTERPR